MSMWIITTLITWILLLLRSRFSPPPKTLSAPGRSASGLCSTKMNRETMTMHIHCIGNYVVKTSARMLNLSSTLIILASYATIISTNKQPLTFLVGIRWLPFAPPATAPPRVRILLMVSRAFSKKLPRKLSSRKSSTSLLRTCSVLMQ
jgi:hypothetical protein